MVKSSFILLSYRKIRLKSSNKDMLILNCVLNKENMYPIFMAYNEMNEEFCKNNIDEDITQFISLRVSNDNRLVAYININ